MNTFSPQTASQDEVLALARRLAFDSPQLTDLTPAQLEHIAQVVVVVNLRDELKRLADLARIDYEKERNAFLLNASRTGSWSTIRAYVYGLCRLEDWVGRHGLAVLELTPRQADNYIYGLRALGRAPASIRLDTAAASAFFSFLERRFDFVRNPFRGSRARPAPRPVREPVIPTEAELMTLINAAESSLRAAIVCMSSRGFRVGALPTLVIEKGEFSGWSKGKGIWGKMPAEALESIEACGLNPRRPFADFSSRVLSHRVRYLARTLAERGAVREAFSAHDLRHYFAVNEYLNHRDLYRLKVLLGHYDVSVTERYLRTIRVL